MPSCLIDGFGPVPVERPRNVAEVGDLVRSAVARGQAVYPLGGQTSLGLGMPPSKPGLGIDIRELSGVIDYPARDMTITVQAGITMAGLQALLAGEKQCLPIEVPFADRATLGGILATNISGPGRLGFGTLRDYVLGISAVNDQGSEIKAGGRVVKNVAGYDLCKLFIGSLGTLGIITQVTLKLRPLAEQRTLILIACSDDALEGLLNGLHGSRTRPVCLEVLNGPAKEKICPDARFSRENVPWTVIAGYEGNAGAIKWQLQQLVRELSGSALDVRLGSTSAGIWQALGDFPGQAGGDENLTFKAGMLASGIGEFCRKADALSDRPQLQAHAGNGIVIGHVGPGLSRDRAAAVMKELRDLAQPFKGYVIVLECPPAWKEAVSVWGPPPPHAWLLREVKEQLDPGGIFNPGRFVDGI